MGFDIWSHAFFLIDAYMHICTDSGNQSSKMFAKALAEYIFNIVILSADQKAISVYITFSFISVCDDILCVYHILQLRLNLVLNYFLSRKVCSPIKDKGEL